MPPERTGKEYRRLEARAKALNAHNRVLGQSLRAKEVLAEGLPAEASDEQPAAAAYRQARVASAQKGLDRAQGLEKDAQARLDQTTPSPDLELSPAAQEAWSKPIAYFVGRKVVSQEEVDALVAAHYRKAEAAINMVFPLVAVYLAVATSLRSTVLRVALGIVVGLVVVLLVVSGQRLNFQFKFRLRELITGRLEQMKAEENQETRTIHDALVLAQKLLAEKKLADAAKAKKEPAGDPRDMA